MIATRRFSFISTCTQFTLSYLGCCQQPWMMAHRITFHDVFDIRIHNRYLYIYMTCDMSLHVSFWGPDRSTAKTRSWHQLRPCISAWWRHLSSRRWQVLVMFRTLSCLDRSENTWCGSKSLQLEMLEKHPVTFSDMPHLTHTGRRLDSLTDIFKAASKASHQRVLPIITIITIIIIIIRSILPIALRVPRKEFVDMPLGVSEADGRPGAGVHFDGFTYQGEWETLALSNVRWLWRKKNLKNYLMSSMFVRLCYRLDSVAGCCELFCRSWSQNRL